MFSSSNIDYDILIAGAGPAGCAAAYDLVRAGRRVLLLDKRAFPRHKACACGLTRKTLAALRYSVEPVIERVCKEIVLQQTSDDPAHREVRVKTRSPICAMAVRERFDHFCLQQTLDAGRHGGGAELKKIDSILALREFPTHIEVEIATNDGPQTLRAAVLIGADGSNGQTRRLASGLTTPNLSSRVLSESRRKRDSSIVSRSGETPVFGDTAEARTTTLPAEPDWYAHGFALEAMVPYTALPAKLPGGDAPGARCPDSKDLVFDFTPIVGGYGWLFPKGDHINIGVGGFVPRADNDANNDRPHEKVTRTLLAEYTRTKLGVDMTAINAHITGQYLGLGGHAYVPQGRVLLTGDAAGLVDPLTGEGIHSAIVSGQAAAAAILETLSATSGTNQSFDLKGTGFSPSVTTPDRQRALAPEGVRLATAYAVHLRPLQETLTFSHRAARSFYADPSRGFRAMRVPLLRSLILKTYCDGLPHTKLLAGLARRVV